MSKRYIQLNSYFHYKFVTVGDETSIIEFGDEYCPYDLGHDPDDSLGEVIATVRTGEKVCFVYEIAEVTFDPSVIKGHVYCGDDVRYPLIQDMES